MDAISVGIDVSKGKSMVSAMRPLGEMVIKPYEVIHSEVELERLAYSLKELEGDLKVVMEATGGYHDPVAQVLHEVGLFVSVVNPKLIKGYGNNSLRKVKTDKADAKKIARYGLEYWDELREYTPIEAARVKLKAFSRQYNLYVKTKVSLKNNLISLLDQTFPGANTLFDSPTRKDGHQKWVDFVTIFWHASCISEMSEKTFIERYRKWCKRYGYHFSESKASDVYIESLGHIIMLPKNVNTKLLVTEAAKQLTAICETVEVFRSELLRLAEMLPEYPVVMGLFGVGDTIGPQLMAELGDVREFENRKQIVAFAGIDPGKNQSGKHDASSVPTSKRGSSPLRKTLFLAVRSYLLRSPADEPVYQFLARKRSEGKKYYVYMTAAANKFLRIYYARVKEYLETLNAEA